MEIALIRAYFLLMAFDDIERSCVVLAEIDIVANGVCHSDCHMVNNDWGVSVYPLIPGTFPMSTQCRYDPWGVVS